MSSDTVVVVAAEWLLTFAIHGFVVLAATRAVSRFGRLPEPVEEVAWRFALVAGLVTASLQTALGGAPIPAVALRDAAPPLQAVSGIDPGGLGFASPAWQPAESALDAGSIVAPTVADGLGIPGLIVLFAALSAVFGLARLGLQRVALRRLLADRRPLLAGGPAPDALARLAARARHRGRIRLSVSSALDAPVAFGVLRPEICVPRRVLTGMTSASRDALLAHELAHLMRGDPLWLEFGHGLRALFPWLPFVRGAVARLRALAEFRSDEVGARLVGAVDVADCLVQVAGWIVDGRSLSTVDGVVGMTVRREGLDVRVERLLDGERTERNPGSPLWVGAGLLVATAVLTAALPGAGVRATPAPIAAGSRPDRPAAVEPAPSPLRSLIEPVEAERLALVAEFALLRDRAADQAADPEISALLTALDAHLRALERQLAAIVAAIEAYEDAWASAESRSVRPEMFR